MRRFLIILLLLIQSFLQSVNAGEINYSVPNFNKNIEYISAQSKQTKTISIDFKNFENAFINTNSKFQEIFTHRNSNNIDGYFIGFLNCDFKSNLSQTDLTQNCYFNNNFDYSRLKNVIHTRAP